jgi:lipoprotein-anchoring transpeptidase ErfK/SrfK
MTLRRRTFMLGSVACLLAPAVPRAAPLDPALTSRYRALGGEPFAVPAIDLTRIRPEFLRREVDDVTREPAGSIVVDPAKHFLYLVQPGGKAMRYGVGVGRSGFAWSGVATVNSKQAWPDWYPPKEMLERQPHLARAMRKLRSGLGMPGGTGNPLGARALYLWQDNRDTLFRIHGTVEPWTIGTNASSGCIRMINQDVMDLYERIEPGARVVVLGASGDFVASTRGGDRLPPLHQLVRDPDALARRGLW